MPNPTAVRFFAGCGLVFLAGIQGSILLTDKIDAELHKEVRNRLLRDC